MVHACRLNGMELLGRIKGKRIMFVGDSLSLNQWQSLICMLHAALPTAKYYIQRNQDLSTFRLPVRFFLPYIYIYISICCVISYIYVIGDGFIELA